MNGWLTDIRKTALIAAMATAAASVLPIKTSLQTTFQTVSTSLANPSWAYWGYILLGIGAVFILLPMAAASLGFLIALNRSETELRIPGSLRLLALIAAVASGLDLFWRIFQEARYLQALPQFQLPSAQAWAVILSGVTYTLFLVAISRDSNSFSSEIRGDRLLRRLAKFSVVLWGIAIVFVIAGTIYLVVQYPNFQRLARLYGRERYLPSLGSGLQERARYILTFALSIIPPYIVLKSLPRKREPAELPVEPA